MNCNNITCTHYDTMMADYCSRGEPPQVTKCSKWIAKNMRPKRSAVLNCSVAELRIRTRCPSCFNTTLSLNDGHLLCTWHECPDPTLIDTLGER